MKILWTFDPFENAQIHRRTYSLLNRICTAHDQIEIIYIASPTENRLATAFDISEAKRFKDYPKGLIQDALKVLHIKAKTLTVIPEMSFSLTASVLALTSYASKKKIDLIVTASRSKKAFDRFMMGSFSETLVHLARTDLLVFKPESRMTKKSPKKIIYAHDFSKKGDRGLARLLTYAKQWGSQVIVIYQPDYAYSIEFEGQDKKTIAQRRHVNRHAQKLEHQLRDHQIEGSVMIKQNWGSISEFLLKTADQEKADIIAVTAQSGRFIAAIGGSVTRQVLRRSPMPVLVLKV